MVKTLNLDSGDVDSDYRRLQTLSDTLVTHYNFSVSYYLTCKEEIRDTSFLSPFVILDCNLFGAWTPLQCVPPVPATMWRQSQLGPQDAS